MAKAKFLTCAHTCKHLPFLDCWSISRRPDNLRGCFIYPTSNMRVLKKHVDRAKFHPECTMDCPACEDHPEYLRCCIRDVNEKEWSEWAGQLARHYPHLANHIPAKYLEGVATTVHENKDSEQGRDGDEHREDVEQDEEDEEDEDEDEEGPDGVFLEQGERVEHVEHVEPVEQDVFIVPTRSSTVNDISASSSNPSPDSGLGASDITSKRKRASDPAASPIPSPKRIRTSQLQRSKHWEIDGNIIIQVGDVTFKLQKSRLAKLSTWFRETFEQMGILNDAEGHDAPIDVDVKGLFLHDFEVLLDTLDSFVTYWFDPPEFNTVASLLRASTALSFTNIKAWSTKYFEEMWSSELADLSTTPTPFAWETVILARECSIQQILKCALYELVRTEGLGQDFALDKEGINDRKLLLKAREKLTSVWITAAASLPSEFLTCCSTTSEARARCMTRSPKSINRAHAKCTPVFEQYKWDPVCGFQALMKIPWKEEGFCQKCIEQRWSTWEKEQKRCWENLDVWFELG